MKFPPMRPLLEPSRRALVLLGALALGALALAPLAATAQVPGARRRGRPAPRAAPAAPAEPAAPRPALTLEALLARFAALPGLHARFHEEKRLQVLAVPLVTDGVLDFAPPERLVRRTTSPDVSVLLIDGGHLRFGDGGGQQQIDLDAQPVVREFVSSFVAIVAGDRPALDRAYAMEFHATDAATDGWEILLRPRSPTMQRVLRDIRLQGRGLTVERMNLREANGDETATSFTEVDTARRYTPEEIARTFRVAP